jgi:SPP1 gp7 family putative phage head morphogenesis protein
MPSTPKQLIEQSTRHAVHLESLKAQSFKEMRTVLQDVNDSLVSRLSRVNKGSAWTKARLESQIAAYRKMLKEDYASGVLKELNKQATQLATYEAGFEQRSLQNVYPKHQFLLPTETQLRTAVESTPLNLGGRFDGTLLGELHKQFESEQINTLTRAIRAAYAGGQTTGELLDKLQRETFPLNERQLESVVRTSLQHTAAQARKATYERNSDIIKGYRIVATLDGRTSSECQVRDGSVEPLDNPDLPPYHFNCRTTYTAVLDDRFAFLEEDATRAARDLETGKIEYVDANQTYYGWLKNQPAAFQDSVLGKTRGELFRDGGLSSERFAELQLNRNFQPRTLEEIKKLEPLAFERAGI